MTVVVVLLALILVGVCFAVLLGTQALRRYREVRDKCDSLGVDYRQLRRDVDTLGSHLGELRKSLELAKDGATMLANQVRVIERKEKAIDDRAKKKAERRPLRQGFVPGRG